LEKAMTGTNESIKKFETSEGGEIFQIPLNAFPGFWVYVYLVLVGEYKVLIDTGSNFHESNQNLEDGFIRVGELIGESIAFEDLTHVFITHGHIDHFAGLAYVRPRSQAKVGIHELDLRNLANYEERLIVTSKRLTMFLTESGVSQERIAKILDMYMMPKALFKSVEVDFTYESVGMKVGPFSFLHTPGHCAGAVVIRLHDILFTGDHILNDITPHQSPERLTLNTGLGTYLESLAKTKLVSNGAVMALGSHKAPIQNVNLRIDEIMVAHKERLAQILNIIDQPKTILEISKILFGKTEGYNVLLAIEETGAHIEYLYQRGFLAINNLGDIQKSGHSVPIEYSRLVDGTDLDNCFL
jgi:glyoxylase-like metal-dependent hydrolase (beta-lactamase superfamily II)